MCSWLCTLISISPERPRLGALASPGLEFGYMLLILIEAFLFNWLFLLLSHSVMSDPLWPHGLQPSRLPYPSLSPWVNSNSYSLSHWCHPTISSSVIPFFSSLQSFPASGSFPMSWLTADAINMNLGKLQEMDSEAWHTAVYGVTKSSAWLGNWTTT